MGWLVLPELSAQVAHGLCRYEFFVRGELLQVSDQKDAFAASYQIWHVLQSERNISVGLPHFSKVNPNKVLC